MNKATHEPCWWYFTFGCGQEYAGCCVKFYGTFSEARHQMCDRFGTHWAFQYSEEEWESMKNDPNRTWPMERELELEDTGN